MYRHVVMFRFNDDVDESEKTAISEGLSSLPGQIPEIKTYHHGSDLGLNEGNFDYVVVADFDTVDEYITYRDHSDHRAVINERIAGRVAERVAVQYQF